MNILNYIFTILAVAGLFSCQAGIKAGSSNTTEEPNPVATEINDTTHSEEDSDTHRTVQFEEGATEVAISDGKLAGTVVSKTSENQNDLIIELSLTETVDENGNTVIELVVDGDQPLSEPIKITIPDVMKLKDPSELNDTVMITFGGVAYEIGEDVEIDADGSVTLTITEWGSIKKRTKIVPTIGLSDPESAKSGTGTAKEPFQIQVAEDLSSIVEFELTSGETAGTPSLVCEGLPAWASIQGTNVSVMPEDPSLPIPFSCVNSLRTASILYLQLVVVPNNDEPRITLSGLDEDLTVPLGDTVTVNWDVIDPDSDASIKVFSSNNKESCESNLLVDNILESGETNSLVIDTNTLGIGTHYICLQAKDEVSTINVFYPGKIIVDVYCSGHNLTDAIDQMGEGTAEEPYNICSLVQLNQIGLDTGLYDKHFKLLQSLNMASLTGTDWNIIGNDTDSFTGVFDGNNKTISNFNYNDPTSDYVGLFGYSVGGTIANLTIANANITGQNFVGSIVGGGTAILSGITATGVSVTGTGSVGGLGGAIYGVENSVADVTVNASGDRAGGLGGYIGIFIHNSSTSGSVTSTANEVGGLAGHKYGACLSGNTDPNKTATWQSFSSATVVGVDIVGGLNGYNRTNNCDARIIESYYTGSVSGQDKIGGLAGWVTSSNGKIGDSWTTGTVSGRDNIGGLVGHLNGNIIQSWSSATVTATGNNAGGIVGVVPSESYCGGVIYKSYYTGSVSGVNKVGGLGGDFTCGAILLSYTTDSATVSGADDTGGLAGYIGNGSYKTYLRYSYSLADVTSTGTNVGGIAGQNVDNEIEEVYAKTGIAMTGTTRGGIVGRNDGGTIMRALWDEEQSTVTVMCGQNTGGGSGCTNSNGYNTADMPLIATYNAEGWDLFADGGGPSDVWYTDGTLPPTLFWQNDEPSFSSRFAGGDGTIDNPFQISSASQLNSIGHNPYLMDKHFRLTSNLDMAPIVSYYPIGAEIFYFHGSLDGNNHTIDNFSLSMPGESNVGLIANGSGEIISFTNSYWSSGIEVKDLTMTNVNVSGGDKIGAVAGNLSGNLTNVHVSGVVANTGTYGYAGLAVGSVFGTVDNSSSSGTVSSAGGEIAGGLIGSLNGTITNSHSTASVSATGTDFFGGTGGLIGSADGTFTGYMNNCYATGNVSGNRSVGGLIGQSDLNIFSSYATGIVSGTQSNIGGLVGEFSSHQHIYNSYATGDVNAATASNVGGLIGDSNRLYLYGSYATGTVTGKVQVGGLIGDAYKLYEMTHSYYDGPSVTGDDYVGGLIGYAWQNDYALVDHVIRDSYAKTDVMGNDVTTQNIGGLFGYLRPDKIVKNVLFNGTVTAGSGITTLRDGCVTGILESVTFESIFVDGGLCSLPDIGYDQTNTLTDVDDAEITSTTTLSITDGTYQVLRDDGWDFDNDWDGDGIANGGYPTLRLPVAIPDTFGL